jgi:hypothetical protein
VAELATEFHLSVQCQQRRSPHKPTQAIVCHTSLSVEVGRNLNDPTWNAIAKDYLQAMGFDQNQYVLARHADTQHDHVHLIVSRLRLDGTTVESWLDYRRAQQVLRQLEKQYDLQAVPPSWETDVKPPTVGEIRQFRRTGEPSVRAMLQVAIDDALLTTTSIDEFQHQLVAQGIEVRLRQIQSGIAGISYKLNEVAFPGYKLGKRYTWSRIQDQLGVNYDRTNSTTCQSENDGNKLTSDGVNGINDSINAHITSSIIANPDQQSGIVAAVREQSRTAPSVGRSGAELNPGESASATVNPISATDSGASRTSESTGCEFESAIADDCFPNDAHSIGASDRHTRSEATPTAASRFSGANQETDCPTGATVEPDSSNGQPIETTCSNQAGVAQDLWIDGNVCDFDRLHDRSNVAPTANVQSEPTQSAASDTEESVTPPSQLKAWQEYSDRIQEKNPVKRDLIVVQLALTDGQNAGVPSRKNFQQAKQLLWQSPYVQWLQEEQGIEKTRTYVKLTLQAAYRENQKSQQPHHSHQRQQQRDRQRTR